MPEKTPSESSSGAQPAGEAALSPGDRLTLDLTSWGRLGEAMAVHQGQSVFVSGGIPGERVEARVVRVHRKYIAARVTDVLEASASRVAPPCPYYGDCTGCQWQHLDYQAQLAAKRDKVVDALERVGGFRGPKVAAVVPSKDRYGYRNHARFTVDRQGTLGFVNRETRQFVRIDNCMLMHQGVNTLLEELQDRCDETTQLSIRAGKYSGDTLIQPTLSNPGVTVPTGQKRYTETVDGRDFWVSSPSFFQVNVEQAAMAASVVRDELALGPDDVLLDAYTGVGTFAILLASVVKKVIAVEESSAAVADAEENASGLENVEFVLGRTEDVLGQLEQRPDAVVLDPPRAGCQARALESLIEMSPPRVAYVSCDAETLGRDLKVLCRGGYRLEHVVPLDMFPQTHHVECVAILSWRGGPVPIVLASASPRRREIMEALELDFSVLPAGVDEDPLPGEQPQDMVQRLSMDKALKVLRDLHGGAAEGVIAGYADADDDGPADAAVTGTSEGFVIGADSVVVFEGQALGKPESDDEARSMLRRLRGTTHHVTTGLTVINAATGRSMSGSMTSEITLRDFSDDEIEASIATKTPRDKAGAYAVQDTDLNPASGWEGCYNNIVGLPVCRLLDMLDRLGYEPPDDWRLPDAAACGRGCPSVNSDNS